MKKSIPTPRKNPGPTPPPKGWNEEYQEEIQANSTPKNQKNPEERYSRIIEIKVGPSREVSEFILRGILQNFNINRDSMYEKLKNICECGDCIYDTGILKQFLTEVINEVNTSKFAKRLKPIILSTLTNSRESSSPIYHTPSPTKPVGKPRPPKSQSSASTTKAEEKDETTHEAQIDDDDSFIEEEKIEEEEESVTEPSPKIKIPRQKQEPVPGSKYLPAFYDNLNF